MRNFHLLILWIGLRHAFCDVRSPLDVDHAFCDLRSPLDVDGIGKCPSVTSVPSVPEDSVENAQLHHPNHLDSLGSVELRRLLSFANKRAKISDARAELAIKRSEGGYFLQLCNLTTELKYFPNTSYKEYV